ncbi:hypothetical protein Lesp02_23830 [Lentzea sp. NBRC 105346]|uniref:hypothetical protein n=1 Tax=Lentzea sp. NBRC 105346 TaxID=3032205 RepID=UPI0024A1E235|nr:hypothetical protein [Lentzea sp. NBRC 105346]GLZ30193.1 hypothetical protein Lesp02_23830 [Lentzea sp. NBRC 105346]
MTAQSSPQESSQAYAFEQYNEQSGGPFMGFMTGGISTIIAATKSIAAANEAGALATDPHAIDSAIKKLDEFQGVLEKIQRRSHVLAVKTPLGGGYADQVAGVNQEVGQLARTQVVPDLNKAIDALKAEIEKSRKSYHNVEAAHSDTFNKL